MIFHFELFTSHSLDKLTIAAAKGGSSGGISVIYLIEFRASELHLKVMSNDVSLYCKGLPQLGFELNACSLAHTSYEWLAPCWNAAFQVNCKCMLF